MKRISLFLIMLMMTSTSFAKNFSAAVSPPRFELATNAGEKVKQTLTLFNLGYKGGQYKVSTNDWKYNHGNLSFHKELFSDSCRQWVKLERRKISVPAGKERKFRFEVHVPKNAPARECSFAIMVESTEPTKNQVGSGIQMPVNGRLAVIVYLAIGGAKPTLQIDSVNTVNYQGMKIPSLLVKNTGKAHGRLSGSLTARSIDGQSFDLSVSNSPIMVGDSERLLLVPSQFKKALKKQSWKYPLELKGKLYWDGGAFSINKKVAG